MATEYTQQQLDQALQQLPEELKATLFSVETSEKLADACERYGIYGEKGVLLSKYVGYVLMGFMLPQDFEQALVKDIKLPKKTSQEIAREINRFVFYPVKPALEQLHNMQVGEGVAQKTEQKAAVRQKEEQEPEEPKGEDQYREALE